MRKTKGKKSRTITLRVPEDFHQRIESEARRRKMSRSALLLEKWEYADAPTFGEVAGKYIGSVEGPGDLSTNPKYMEGFGLTNAQLARLERPGRVTRQARQQSRVGRRRAHGS